MDSALNNTSGIDPWSIGTLQKQAIWSYYVIANYTGVALCSVLLGSIIRYPNKNSTDICIGTLLTGCIWMSITCGSECLVSVIHHYFYGGVIACKLEAFFHISSILVQFFSVALISIRAYLIVVKGIELSIKHALYVSAGIWGACIAITYSLSYVSPIYLMTAGTYCFFGFSSPEIAYWLVPMLGAALATMAACYYQILRHAKQSAAVTHTVTPATQKMALRCLWFIVVLLGGWFFAAVASVYEFSVGITPEWLVTAVGAAGVTHSVAVPLTYLRTNRYHLQTFRHVGRWLCALCICDNTASNREMDGSIESSNVNSSQKALRYPTSSKNVNVSKDVATVPSVLVQSLTLRSELSAKPADVPRISVSPTTNMPSLTISNAPEIQLNNGAARPISIIAI